jgi:ATP-dependent DNA helicase DinG
MNSASLLSENGPFAELIPQFKPRSSQLYMAKLIEGAFSENESKIIEAPSGSGKTLAYLVPIVLENRVSIISTATHYLQDQLFKRDIPLVQKALGTKRKVAIMKGRRNYICPYYLARHCHVDSGLSAKPRAQLANLLKLFNSHSSKQMLQSLPQSLLTYATSTTEDCLGAACPQYDKCPFFEARKKAQKADVVVVNHSLLFADQVLREEQFTELLPRAEVVVVDEAHRLAEFAQTLVGEALSSAQLSRYCQDAEKVIRKLARDQKPALDFILQFQRALGKIVESAPPLHPYQRHQHVAIVNQLISGLLFFSDWLSRVASRDVALEQLLIRNKSLRVKLEAIGQEDGLCWLEATRNGFSLKTVPVELSSRIQELIFRNNSTWIFTSATLSVENKATNFSRSLGLTEVPFFRTETEFDHLENARLYTPIIGVEPSNENYSKCLLDKVLPLLRVNSGRVLFLFTSHSALQKMASLLKGVDGYSLYVQGSMDNYQLIERFRQKECAILLGTGSFWEGLDLSTVPLSCVIIDKLPFASHFEPLVQLRSFDLEGHGVNSFSQYILPDAVIRLKQGCGRLLRRLSDRGVIMLADPRIHSMSYGSVFLNSLPPMEKSCHLEPLTNFIRGEESS